MKTESEIETRIKELDSVINQCNELGKKYVAELDLKKKDFKNIDSLFYQGHEALKQKQALEWVLNKQNG